MLRPYKKPPHSKFFKFFLALRRKTCVHSHLPVAPRGVTGNFRLRALEVARDSLYEAGESRPQAENPAEEARNTAR